MIRQWANHYKQPEAIVDPRDVVGLSEEKKQELYRYVRLVADCLRRAFETRDPYMRDWFLIMARYNNAVELAPLGPQFGRKPGVIPVAKDSAIDRAIWVVQRRLVQKMAVCPRKQCRRRYFFRTRKNQKYCCFDCAHRVRLAGNLRWFKEVGSERRRQKQRSSPLAS